MTVSVASPSLLRKLTEHVSPGNIVSEPGERERFASDKSGLGPYQPSLAVLPTTEAEVEAVLRLAAEEKIPVTPRGGGSGLTGGALPARGGIVLSLERMNAILDFDPASRVVVAQAGVLTGDFADFAEERGMFYPPCPNSLRISTLGGNFAHNSSGPRSFKYGSIQDYALSARAVLMGGGAIRTGNPGSKSFSGYNLTGLLLGSEGTLAVVTELAIRLLPAPECRRTWVFEYDLLRDAVAAAQKLALSGIDAAALDVMDGACAERVRNAGHFEFRARGCNALLIEFDGNMDTVQIAENRTLALLSRPGFVHAYTVGGDEGQAVLWKARRAVFPEMMAAFPGMMVEDVCVPVARLGDLVDAIERFSLRFGVHWAAVGNIGEGNLHIAALFPEHTPESKAKAGEFFAGLLQVVLELKGSLSFEHGISLKKMASYSRHTDPTLLRLQMSLKAAFDPECLLNPGKIFA